MSSLSLTDMNTCSLYGADSTFYCIPTGIENCCTGDVDSLWSEAFAKLSTSLYATSDYTAPSTTSMTTETTAVDKMYNKDLHCSVGSYWRSLPARDLYNSQLELCESLE
jgi:hypothetical protein